MRRYSEFYALRIALCGRWPGIYIPAIPEKKAVGNKEGEFVEERRSLLELFLKQCAKYEYIINSCEFKIFARESGEIDRMLKMLPAQSPVQILEKYRKTFTIDESLDTEKVTTYKENLKEFKAFLLKAMVQMGKNKNYIKRMVDNQKIVNDCYKQAMEHFIRYEQSNVVFYSEGDIDKQMFSNPDSDNMVEKVEESVSRPL